MSSFRSLTFYFFTFFVPGVALLTKVPGVVLTRSGNGDRSYLPSLKGKAFRVLTLSIPLPVRFRRYFREVKEYPSCWEFLQYEDDRFLLNTFSALIEKYVVFFY